MDPAVGPPAPMHEVTKQRSRNTSGHMCRMCTCSFPWIPQFYLWSPVRLQP